MSCLIVGDGVAVGLAKVIKGCIVAAHVGISSASLAMYHSTPAVVVDTAFIALGSDAPVSTQSLDGVRETFSAKVTYWVLPAKRYRGSVIIDRAYYWHDRIETIIPNGKGYPRSFRELALTIPWR